MPATRMVHYAGDVIAIVLMAAFAATLEPSFAITAITTVYAFAWLSHFLIERNNPASFKHPLWSARGGIRMFSLWVSNRLKPELVKAGLPASKI